MKIGKPTLSDRRPAPAARDRPREPDGLGGVGRAAVTIAAASVVGLLGAAAYLHFTPTRHTIVSKLVVERVNAPASRGVFDSTDAFLAAQADVIRSSEVLRLADTDAELGKLPTLAGRNDPLPAIRQGLNVAVAGNGGVLTLTYASTSVEDARRIVDAVVRAYVSYQSDKKRERAATLSRDAEGVRGPIVAEVARATRALAEAESNLTGRGAPAAVLQRVRSTVDALVQMQAVTVDARRAYDDAVAEAGPLLSKMSDEDLDRAIRTSALGGEPADRVAERLDIAVRQMAELRRTYAENHPAVVRQRTQIERLRIERVAAARRGWQSATTREAEAKAITDRAAADAAAIAALEAERDRRRDELARLQSRLAEADKQVDLARGVTAGTSLNVEVITSAESDDARYPPTPRIPTTLALGLLAGLGVGATLATIGEYRRAGTLRHVTPRHVAPRRNGDASAEARLAREAFKLRVLGSVPELAGGGNDQAAKLRADPAAPLARAADKIRAALEAEDFIRGTLAVTSQREGEGRSTIALALASSMARAGARVLLIDANGGRDDATAAPGFVEALEDGEIDERLKATAVPGLLTLPGGRSSAAFIDRLNSPALPELLARCAQAYDQVVVDCAPLGAGDSARIVAASCDATMLVSDGAVASLRRAASGRDVLQLVGANVLGVAINRVRHTVEPHLSNGLRAPSEV